MIGGSNDQSYSNARGLMNAVGGAIDVVNVDAHLDVRPQKEGRHAVCATGAQLTRVCAVGKEHSGSPFRQLLEDKHFSGSFLEFAAQV